MMMENLVELKLAGETEVFGENLAQRYFVHQKSHFTRPGLNPGRIVGKPATNRLSYGAAKGNLSETFLFAFPLVYHALFNQVNA
jgi:hypothetical protein